MSGNGSSQQVISNGNFRKFQKKQHRILAIDLDQCDDGARVSAFAMIKILAAVILIAAALMSGHRWRSPTATGGVTVGQSTSPNGNIFETAWVRMRGG